MKRRFALLLAAAVLLCGCAKKAPAAETDAPETVASVPRATASRQEREKTRMSVFKETVENLAYESRLPDGSTVPQGTDSASMDGNFFALADVNGDGEQELILNFLTGPAASMSGFLCGYDETAGSLTIELQAFPAFRFYPRGLVEAQLSHNQGLAGDALWPYTLYRYVSGAFAEFASVDAWDKTMGLTDCTGTPFPEETDADGDGIVYLVTREGRTEAMDGEAYAQWRRATLGTEVSTPVTYYSITRDNIRQAFADTEG